MTWDIHHSGGGNFHLLAGDLDGRHVMVDNGDGCIDEGPWTVGLMVDGWEDPGKLLPMRFGSLHHALEAAQFFLNDKDVPEESWADKFWRLVGKRRVDIGKYEIQRDVRSGIVPNTVKDFSQLHDFVDANLYGWGSESWYEGACGHDDYVNFWNRVQAELDAWIKSGELRNVSTRP